MDALDALGRLPERQRVAVTLRYLEDMPYAGVSAATGWARFRARKPLDPASRTTAVSAPSPTVAPRKDAPSPPTTS